MERPVKKIQRPIISLFFIGFFVIKVMIELQHRKDLERGLPPT